jgi:hypothetical protein
MAKQLKRKRSHHGPSETGPRPPRSALPYPVAPTYVGYDQLANFGIPRFTRVHLGRMMAAGLFPVAFQLSPNRIAWRLTEVQEWLASRPVARSVKGVRRRAAREADHG